MYEPIEISVILGIIIGVFICLAYLYLFTNSLDNKE